MLVHARAQAHRFATLPGPGTAAQIHAVRNTGLPAAALVVVTTPTTARESWTASLILTAVNVTPGYIEEISMVCFIFRIFLPNPQPLGKLYC